MPLQAEIPCWKEIKSGAWKIVKPFDWVTDKGTVEFNPGEIKRKSMEEIGNDIRDNWKNKKTSYVCPNVDEKALESILNESEPKSPEKNHVLIYWYGTGCYPKRTFLKFVHYKPFTFAATGMKYMVLAAFAGMGIEQIAKRIKKYRKKSKEKEGAELESGASETG